MGGFREGNHDVTSTHSRRVATVCLWVSNTLPGSGIDLVACSGFLLWFPLLSHAVLRYAVSPVFVSYVGHSEVLNLLPDLKPKQLCRTPLFYRERFFGLLEGKQVIEVWWCKSRPVKPQLPGFLLESYLHLSSELIEFLLYKHNSGFL